MTRLYDASHRLTTYLRHGDRHNNNYHSDDGYVDVSIIVQLPQFANNQPHPINQRCIELLLMLWDSRIEADSYHEPPNTRIRAIQGHTRPGLNIDRLYTEIKTPDDFNNSGLWDGDPPDHAIVELCHEEDIRRWYRMGIYPPSKLEQRHTLKVTKGTGPQHLKEKTVLYAFIEIKSFFENKIPTYITNAGRLVIPQNLPFAIVEMVRDLMGNEINSLAPRQVPNLEVGPPQVRDIREPARADEYRMGGNSGGLLPMEPTFTETTDGKQLRGHYHHFIWEYCKGSPIEQENELQMCRGKYKELLCRNVNTQQGCNNQRRGTCPFRHPDDNEQDIARHTTVVRHRIFTAMDADDYALPSHVRLEIGQITRADYEAMERRKYEHDQKVEDSKGKAKGKGNNDARSRSPRSNSRTPTPDRVNENKGKGRGKSLDPTPAESIAAPAATTDALGSTDSRQRDHTSGGQDEQSDAEVAAPPTADNTIAEEQVDKEDNEDNLPDFGSSPVEPKEETDETPVETNETMEQADQDMTPADND